MRFRRRATPRPSHSWTDPGSRRILGLAAAVAAPLLTAGHLALPSPASAQIRAGGRASVSQTVDGTVMSVDYSRPRARGRTELFGGVVHWGEVWTPGANEATALEINRDVTIEGTPVPAGSWSVWMVVEPGDQWELVLDPRPDLFHTVHPGPTDDQIRFPVAVEEGEHTEALTWSFPTYELDRTTLVMAWGTTRVPLEIEVESTVGDLAITADAAAPYLGSWEQTFLSVPEGFAPPGPVEMEIRFDDRRLVADTRLGPADSAQPVELLLMPRAEGIFGLGFLNDGTLVDAPPGLLFEFVFGDDGRAVEFELRDAEDAVVMEGTRIR